MRSTVLSLFFLFILGPVSGVAQINQIPVDSLIQLPGSSISASFSDDEFGLEITQGDFNGDGIMDIVTSSPESEDYDSDSGQYTSTPTVTIYYGENDFKLSSALKTRITFPSTSPITESHEDFGLHLGSGDLNNDGIDDILIGYPTYDNQKGRAYVVYGRQSNEGQAISVENIAAGDGFYVEGLSEGDGFRDPGSRMGTGFAVGDFDGDGLNDLALNAPHAINDGSVTDYNNRDWEGRSYVIYGDAITGKVTIGLDTLSSGDGTVFYVSNMQGATGSRSLFTDLNGDDLEDLVIGAEDSWSQGRVFGFFGTPSRPDSIDISTFSSSIGTTIYGAFSPTLSEFGKDVASGDFNGDGLEDLVASAPRLDLSTAAITIFFGGTDTFDGFIRSDSPDDIPSLTITGTDEMNILGTFLDLADFNGDGFEDLVFSSGILGKKTSNYLGGSIFIVAGTDQSIPDTLDLGNPAPEFDIFELTTNVSDLNMGYSIQGADLNNDGSDDLVYGIRSNSPNSSDPRSYIRVISSFSFELDSTTSDTLRYAFSGGSGTENDPFIIETEIDFDSVRHFMDAHFLQVEDLDLSTNGYDTLNGWIPIGFDEDDEYLTGEPEPFTGSYDGGIHAIRNVLMDQRGVTLGLFYKNEGTIQNLVVSGAEINYYPSEEVPGESLQDELPRYAGIIAGVNEGTIRNTAVHSASIKFGSIGLISGRNRGLIESTYVEGVLDSADQMGGITSLNNGGTVTLSGANIELKNADATSGGVVSTNVYGTVTRSYANSTVSKVNQFGGIAGIYQYGKIRDTYAGFSIEDGSSVGGLVGSLGYNGMLDPTNGPVHIKNNYVYGGRELEPAGNNYYNPIIGFSFTSVDTVALRDSVSNNYWNTELFGDPIISDDTKFYILENGITSREMKDPSTFTGWDFLSVWELYDNSTFPMLTLVNQPIAPGEDIVTSSENTSDLPSRISLKQNYPNPFNPSTVISYQLPVSSHVRLQVFDMLGREVATLEDGIKQAGTHQVTFDAGNLSSGMYMYRLNVGATTITKKLTLIK